MDINPRHAGRQSAEAVHEKGGRRGNKRHTNRARSGAAMRNYAESASEGLRNEGEAANHIAQRSMEQLSKVLGLSTEAVQQSVQLLLRQIQTFGAHRFESVAIGTETS